jgi:hypothetical protein
MRLMARPERPAFDGGPPFGDTVGDDRPALAEQDAPRGPRFGSECGPEICQHFGPEPTPEGARVGTEQQVREHPGRCA